MKLPTLLPLLTVALLGAAAARAQSTLVGFDFSQDSPNNGAQASSTATVVDASVTAGALTRGGGFGAPNVDNTTKASFGFSPPSAPFQTNVADATSLNQYVTFTLTPKGSVSLSALQFGVGAQNSGAGGAPDIVSGGLTYSVDGGATFTAAAATLVSSPNGGYVGNGDVYSFDLTPAGSVSSPVIFRLFLLENPAGGQYNNGAFRIGSEAQADQSGLDVFVTGGAASVPEPATAAGGFLLVAVLGGSGWANRRRSST